VLKSKNFLDLNISLARKEEREPYHVLWKVGAPFLFL
jgi:hypothetical protein